MCEVVVSEDEPVRDVDAHSPPSCPRCRSEDPVHGREPAVRREGLQTPATALRAEAQLLLTGRGLGGEVGGPEGQQEGRAPAPGPPGRSGVSVQKKKSEIDPFCFLFEDCGGRVCLWTSVT